MERNNQENKNQVYVEKLGFNLKQILMLSSKKLFPPTNNQLHVKTIKQQIYLEGIRQQVKNYLKQLKHNIENYHTRVITFKKMIMVEKIQYEVQGLHNSKVIRPNTIKIVANNIIKKYNLIGLNEIVDNIFKKGNNFIIVSFLKSGQDQVLSKIDNTIEQYQCQVEDKKNIINQKSKTRIDQQQIQEVEVINIKTFYDYKYGKEDSQNYTKNSNQHNQNKKSNLSLKNKKLSSDNQLSVNDKNQIKKILFSQKFNLQQFDIQNFKNWVKASKKLKPNDIQYNRISKDQIIISLLSYNFDSQKIQEIKMYMNSKKTIRLNQYEYRQIQDITNTLNSHRLVKIQIIKNCISANNQTKKVKNVIDNYKYQDQVNKKKSIDIKIEGIKPQVQKVQSIFNDLIKSKKQTIKREKKMNDIEDVD